MRPTMWNDARGAQFIIDIPLSSAARAAMRVQAQRFLERCRRRDDQGRLVVHVKRDGPQVACHAHLFSDREEYHSSQKGWDVRQVIDGTLEAIDHQRQQHHERHADLRA